MASLVESKYILGDLVRIWARFQDPDTLAYLQPSGGVTTEVMDPDGVVTTPAAVFDAHLATVDGTTAAGYYADINATKPGNWHYRFAGTGVGQAADEGDFYVERSRFS